METNNETMEQEKKIYKDVRTKNFFMEKQKYIENIFRNDSENQMPA